jgi:hypothetical protein
LVPEELLPPADRVPDFEAGDFARVLLDAPDAFDFEPDAPVLLPDAVDLARVPAPLFEPELAFELEPDFDVLADFEGDDLVDEALDAVVLDEVDRLVVELLALVERERLLDLPSAGSTRFPASAAAPATSATVAATFPTPLPTPFPTRFTTFPGSTCFLPESTVGCPPVEEAETAPAFSWRRGRGPRGAAGSAPRTSRRRARR